MEDKFWINTWIFFAIVTVLGCFMMGGLFLLDNKAQHSEEISIEEKEAIHGITYELWDEFRYLVPIMFFTLLISAWVYIKFGNIFAKEVNNNGD